MVGGHNRVENVSAASTAEKQALIFFQICSDQQSKASILEAEEVGLILEAEDLERAMKALNDAEKEE